MPPTPPRGARRAIPKLSQPPESGVCSLTRARLAMSASLTPSAAFVPARITAGGVRWGMLGEQKGSVRGAQDPPGAGTHSLRGPGKGFGCPSASLPSAHGVCGPPHGSQLGRCGAAAHPAADPHPMRGQSWGWWTELGVRGTARIPQHLGLGSQELK